MSTELPADLLDLPTSRASRIVALQLLERASAAHLRLGDPQDTEALHDFRVALRRLRSWIRAFRPWLRESVGKRMRVRLRALADATNASRDAEVHIEWIAAQHARLSSRQRIGARWLEQRLSAAKLTADTTLYETVASRFSKLHDRLDRNLREYTVRVRLDESVREPRFSRDAARLLREHAADLRSLLAAVRTPADQTESHRARIAGKRVRYLLEPLGELLPPASELVERLKDLQDALGDVHDAQVFATELTTALQESAAEQARALSHSVLTADDETAALRAARKRDPRPGLVALARLLRERGDAAFARVERDWLGDASQAFFDDVERLAASLEQRHAAGVEIERKYLLSALPPRAQDAPRVEIAQGYIPGERLIERLRHERSDEAERWIRTVKSGPALARLEVEEDTTAATFKRMWPLTRGHRLTKRRYRVQDTPHLWEIDEFTDRTLYLAEVELPDADAAVEPPDWLAPYVERDVTGMPEYANARLAK